MTIVLVSFLSRPSCANLRVLARVMEAESHHVILVFADVLMLPSKESVQKLASWIITLNPDLVGMSVYTDHVGVAKTLTAAIHRHHQTKVVWGGPHATAAPLDCIKLTDFVCVGEGEDALTELCRSLDSGQDTVSVPGILKQGAWATDSEPIGRFIDDLDGLPFPNLAMPDQFVWEHHLARRLSPHELVERLEYKYDISTSRGCPYACSYCYNDRLRILCGDRSRFVRRRSITNVIAELKQALSVLPRVDWINFWDDCFVREADYIEEFCRLYKKEIGLPFYCLSRLEFMDDRRMRTLCDAGLAVVQLGVQTAGKRTLGQYRRSLPAASDVEKIGRTLISSNVFVIYDIILNNPYESVNEVIETVRFFFNLPRPFVVNGWNLYFSPGTVLYRQAIGDGFVERIDSKKLFHFSSATINSPMFFPFDNEMPSGSYRCCYDCSEKRYLNTLLAMMSAWPQLLIKALFYGRGVLPLSILRFIWDRDLFVSERKRRLCTKHSQLTALRELIASSNVEKVAALLRRLRRGPITDSEVCSVYNAVHRWLVAQREKLLNGS